MAAQTESDFENATRVVRKEYRRLSGQERDLFHEAMNWAKTEATVEGKTIYDLLSSLHNPIDSANHMGPSFFPWHREYIKERGGKNHGTLLGPWIYGYMDNVSDFNEFNFCKNETFLVAHTIVHLWVGGTMGYEPASPSDPSFFLLHTFIDYLWERWRQKHQTKYQREHVYPSDNASICGIDAYLPKSKMLPFSSLANIDGLSSRYTDEFYTYEDHPTCSKKDPDSCGSPYLFCNLDEEWCMSKVLPGGNCTAFQGFDTCYEEKCAAGVCPKSENHTLSLD